jgi:PTS system nitrogen regulatory IIA component
MKLVEFVREDLILPELRSKTKPQLLGEVARHLAHAQPGIDADVLTRVLLDREELGSTAIGEEIAIPHGKLPGVTQLLGCIGRSTGGVQFDSLDGRPTHLFFVLVAPEHSTGLHLKALARISRVCKDPEFRTRLLRAKDGPDMYRTLAEEDERH